MAEPRGFTVTDGLLGLDRVKVWMLPGLLGNVVFWEWRYFQTVFKVSDTWPKEQRHNGTLCIISEKFELPSDSFCFPKDFGVGKGWLVSTRGLVALCSSISSRPGPRTRARRELALAFSRSFVTLAAGVIEEMAAHEKVDLKILGVPITVSGRGRLPGLERVAHRRPELVEAWDRLAPRCGLPAFDTCDLVHLWRFAEGVTVTRHSCIMPGIVEWASSMVVGLSRLVAFCIEKKVDQSCRAEHRVEPPRPLFGPKGSRRNVDEVERLEQFRKARKAKGSQTTSLTAMGYDGLGLDTVMTHNRLYKHCVSEKFQGQEVVSVTWDPGTYGGESTSVGLLWASRLGEGCFLPVKVLHPPGICHPHPEPV